MNGINLWIQFENGRRMGEAASNTEGPWWWKLTVLAIMLSIYAVCMAAVWFGMEWAFNKWWKT